MSSGLIAPPDTTTATQEAKVAAVWGGHWQGVDGARLDALYRRLAAPPPWYRRPFLCGPADEVKFLSRGIGDLSGKRVLEFGSGIGWTSLWLARAGAEVTVADVNPEALALSRQVFARAGCRAQWTEASVFAPESLPPGFDLVFNSGLIEHFHRDDQLRLVRSMAQLARPGGHVAVFAPYSGGRLYVWSKRRLERLGRWRFGDEFPLHTMADLATATGLEVVCEHTAKPGDQWNMLAGLHPGLAQLGRLLQLSTLGDLTPLWRWCIGDSMLATLFRRPR